MKPVYAVLYTADGQVLLAYKNRVKYFFLSPQDQGIVAPNGDPIVSGPGLAALPGGETKQGEGFDEAAMRVFYEETGADLRDVPKMWYAFDDDLYCAVYFRVDNADFFDLATRIISVNLMAGHDAVDEVRRNPGVTYAQLMAQRPKPPEDNELRSADVVQILALEGWERVKRETNRSGIRRYYFILGELREQLKQLQEIKQ